MTEFSDAAADLHSAFADPIIYTGAGLDGATITGTKYDVAAEAFQGAGSTARRVWFEIQQSDLPQAPAKRNGIRHTDPMTGITSDWSVIDIARRDDIGAFDLTVEKA
ncbi:hypothetical protein [Sphingobium yanoikuyae]|jgi:hypothetical protein|uniref:hypothetical protein n=1 Tax=Sphingobium yanoikuyae TaxID=13690 RepID=UPI0028A93C25|nr:hypothetical protein [Sphingobium yanoikuyae]